MSYMALYRKYRPDTFEDVKGQEHITTTLKNQIRAGRIGHAYLFCGTRGTGKTTVAKIFAKAVNCENPQNGSPCGECPTCRAVADGTSMNVMEIDAASNNGVENIRQIKEEVTYAPTGGKYRVYIIDEVHMLSIGAFNALLKTLEEPPSYVIFILATTEAHKIPITILSRCQRYDFHRISVDTIADRLTELMAEEGTQVEERAIRYIAKAADGSMRDALSLLDQCISFYIGQTLTYENVLDVLGAVDTEVFRKLFLRIMEDDVTGAVAVVEELILQGRELGQFVTDFIWYLRSLLLVRASDQMEEVLDVSAENLALLRETAEQTEPEVIMRYIRVFSELSADMRYAAQKRVMLEIAIMKLCRPEMEQTQDALLDRIARLERKMEQGIPVMPASAQPAGGIPARSAAEVKTEVPAIRPNAVPEEIQQVVKNWHRIVPSFEGGLMRSYLNQAHLSLAGDNKLMLVFDDDMAYTYVSGDSNRKAVSEAISRSIGKEVELLIKENQSGRAFEDNYVDLTKVIHMDVEEEDE